MTKSLALLINPGAGSVPARPENGFIEALERAAAWANVEVRLIEGDFEAAILKACRADLDYLAVAGGDGTARAVCEKAAEKELDCRIIPLPLGTANFLPRRLYGDRDAETILREARDYGDVRLHAGRMEDKLFFVSASVGFVTRFAEAREAVRQDGLFRGLGKLWRHLGAGIDSIFSTRLSLYADGEDKRYTRSRAVLLAPGGLTTMFGASRSEPGEARLEVVAADPRHVREVADLGLRALMRRWRDHPRVQTRWVDSLEVNGRERLAIMLDGEPFHRDSPVEFTLKPEAVRFVIANST